LPQLPDESSAKYCRQTGSCESGVQRISSLLPNIGSSRTDPLDHDRQSPLGDRVLVTRYAPSTSMIRSSKVPAPIDDGQTAANCGDLHKLALRGSKWIARSPSQSPKRATESRHWRRIQRRQSFHASEPYRLIDGSDREIVRVVRSEDQLVQPNNEETGRRHQARAPWVRVRWRELRRASLN
jgi:hypothetical protein